MGASPPGIDEGDFAPEEPGAPRDPSDPAFDLLAALPPGATDFLPPADGIAYAEDPGDFAPEDEPVQDAPLASASAADSDASASESAAIVPATEYDDGLVDVESGTVDELLAYVRAAMASSAPLPAPAEPAFVESAAPAAPVASNMAASAESGVADAASPAEAPATHPEGQEAPAAPAETRIQPPAGEAVESDAGKALADAESTPARDPADVFAQMEASGDAGEAAEFNPADVFAQFSGHEPDGGVFGDDPELAALQAEYDKMGDGPESPADGLGARAGGKSPVRPPWPERMRAFAAAFPAMVKTRSRAAWERALAFSRVKEHWRLYIDILALLISTVAAAVILSWWLWY